MLLKPMKRVNVSQNLHVFQTLSVKAFPNQDLQEKQSQNLDGQLIYLTSGCEIVREITDTGKTYSKNPRGFADHENLNYSLCAFITEFRKENGEEYLDNTLYDIILALKLTS